MMAVLLAAMLIASCDSDDSSGYRVTFNSDGGSDVASQNVEEGGYAKAPTNPTHTGWGLVRWSTTQNGTEAFDFEKTAITGDITLYAVWEKSYTVGNAGPAGGVIVYDVDADDTTGNDDGLTSSSCGWRYLESVSAALEQYEKYCTDSTGSFGTKTGLGEGKNNTEVCLNGEKFPLATRCADYSKKTNSGLTFDDWFLPSKEELKKVISSRKVTLLSSGTYASSSEIGGDEYYIVYYSNGINDSSYSYTDPSYVFPVRRF